MVNMEGSKSIRGKLKKTITSLLKPFQKKGKTQTHANVTITEDEKDNLKTVDVPNGLPVNNNTGKLEGTEINEPGSDAATNVTDKEYDQLLHRFDTFGIQEAKTEKKDKDIAEKSEVIKDESKNRPELFEDRDVSAETKLSASTEEDEENEEEDDSEDENFSLKNIKRTDSECDSGYDDNRVLEMVAKEYEEVTKQKNKKPIKIAHVSRGHDLKDKPKVGLPNTEPYQLHVNRRAMSGGKVVVPPESTKLSPIPQEVFAELNSRVSDETVHKLLEFALTGPEEAQNIFVSNVETNVQFNSPLNYDFEYDQNQVQGFNIPVNGYIQDDMKQGFEVSIYNQVSGGAFGASDPYEQVFSNGSEPNYGQEFPQTIHIEPELPQPLPNDQFNQSNFSMMFESRGNFGELSEQDLEKPFVFPGLMLPDAESPNSSIEVNFEGPYDPVFSNIPETGHEGFTPSYIEQELPQPMSNAFVSSYSPVLSNHSVSPTYSSFQQSPPNVPNDSLTGFTQACSQLDFQEKGIYKHYYPITPPSIESPSPQSDFGAEIIRDLPNSPAISTSSGSNENTLKRTMPVYKKQIKDLKDSFVTKMCCIKFDSRKLSEYFEKLSDLKKNHLITYTNNMQLRNIQKCILQAMKTVHSEQEIEIQFAIIFYLCEKLMRQNKEEYLKSFGLDVLRSSVLWCFRHPLVAYYIVQNIYTAYKLMKQSYKQPIFSETDMQGDNLIVFCARAGDSYADVLSAMCDVRENCPPLLDFNHYNHEGHNALHVACMNHSKEKPHLHIVHVLLHHAKMDIYSEDTKGGEISLHLAVNSPTCDFDLILMHFQGFERKDWHRLANHKNEERKLMSPKAMAKARSSRPDYPEDVYLFLDKCR